MQDILKLARIQILVLVLFIVFKVLRPICLQSKPNELFELFLLSFPNFCEAVIGVLLLTGLGLYLNQFTRLKKTTIYILAILLAAIYVITQEVKLHNLGGNNVYDPFDVLFSIIGIVTGALIIFWIKPGEIEAV